MSDDITADVIKKTQKILGKYVRKPPLTDKLLKKPPFRFLHDVINVIINETGYLKGLFSEEELKTENVKDKDAKVAFLNKLIDAVKATTKTDLAVRSNKIVAGLEPTKTNLLLQTIGKALDSKIDTADYVAKLSSGKADTTEKKKSKKTSSSHDDKTKVTPKTKTKDELKVTKSKRNINESPRSKGKAITPKDSSRNKNKIDKTNAKKEIKSKDEKQESPREKEEQVDSDVGTVDQKLPANENVNDTVDHKVSMNNEHNEDVKNQQETDTTLETLKDIKKSDSGHKEKIENVEMVPTEKQGENTQLEDGQTRDSTILKRPKSARPKSGEMRIVSSKQRSENVHKDEILKPLEMTMNQPPQRPKSSLRPPSVRPSSARPGAPRLRPESALPLQETITMGNINVIIENVDNADEEETVVIQTTPEVIEEPASSIEVPQENKGQLVEQILEQIQEEEGGVKKKVDIDWEDDVLHNKDGASREITQLRALIQTLTKTANPLGKLMNYLHEDVDAMHGELQMWTNVKVQLFSEINKQKRFSAEANKPLLTHLQQLQEEIRKQEHEIINVRSNILKNELRIKELLSI